MPSVFVDAIDDTSSKSRVNVYLKVEAHTSETQPLYCGNKLRLVGIYVPGGWVAVNITFMASYDGIHWRDIASVGGVLSLIASGPGCCYQITGTEFLPWNWIKILSGTRVAPIMQPHECILRLVLKSFN
jgi:hypothetical protein